MKGKIKKGKGEMENGKWMERGKGEREKGK